MQPIPLEYSPRQSRWIWWWPILRFLLLGPCTGAMIGFAQTSAAVLCWIAYGQPDFYFRGWDGVDLTYLGSIVGGGFIGIAYGLGLWTFEHLTGRRIRSLIVIPLLLVLAFAAAASIAAIEFRRQSIWFLPPESIAIVLGVVLSIATSRRAPRLAIPVDGAS
jgi:hypothetical protein